MDDSKTNIQSDSQGVSSWEEEQREIARDKERERTKGDRLLRDEVKDFRKRFGFKEVKLKVSDLINQIRIK